MAGRLEQNMQKEFVRMARLLNPELEWRLFHIPNGGARAKSVRIDKKTGKEVRYSVEAAILKAMGVVPGMCDLGVLLGQGRIGFLEAKDPPDPFTKKSRGKLSTEQEAMRDRLLGDGYLWAEFRTVDEGLKTLRAWGVPLRNFYM